MNVNVNVHTLNYIFILRRGLLGILKKDLFYLILVVLGLYCCAWAFSNWW